MNPNLFAPDPIDYADPSPYAALEFYGHLIVGAIWFVCAIAALLARKGGKLHIHAGQLCILAVLLTSLTAVMMLAVEFVPPLFLNAFTASYAVITAWLALKPRTRRVAWAEYALSALEAIILTVFMAVALRNIMAGGVPIIGPLTVMAVPIILLLGDLNFYRKPEQRPRLRLARHLARMCWAFAIVLRAPLVEFETAGYYNLPDLLLVAGPPLLGLAMIVHFQRRYGTLKAQS